jgi:colanic acid biosynthesis protein WcaH
MSVKEVDSTSHLPPTVYRICLESVPICCVDLIIHQHNKFWLFKRTNWPVKGEWWLPGGRIMRGRKPDEEALRIAKKETKMDMKIEKFIGAYSTVFRKGHFVVGDFVEDEHVITLCYLVSPKSGGIEDVKLDKQASKVKAFGKVDRDWHPYIVNVIEDSGLYRKDKTPRNIFSIKHFAV